MFSEETPRGRGVGGQLDVAQVAEGGVVLDLQSTNEKEQTKKPRQFSCDVERRNRADDDWHLDGEAVGAGGGGAAAVATGVRTRVDDGGREAALAQLDADVAAGVAFGEAVALGIAGVEEADQVARLHLLQRYLQLIVRRVIGVEDRRDLGRWKQERSLTGGS